VPAMHQAIDDFIGRSARAEKPAQLFDLFAGMIGKFGFSEYTYIGFHIGDATERFPIVKSTYPTEWAAYYHTKEYVTFDPVVISSAKSVVPIEWRAARSKSRLSPKQRLLFDEAGEFGISDGVTVPIHGFGGEFATLSIASVESERDFEKTWRAHRHVVHSMSLYLHARIAERLVTRREPAKPIALSDRETECLTWMARGKTNWEISEILRLSEKTIESYLENVKAKFGVYTKTQVVVKAIMQGLIRP
jgi:DNA-binding CsgD family transcriptional regulator